MTLSTELKSLYDAGRIEIAGLIKFEFGTGTYGFIRGPEEFQWNGLTYLPGGVIQISDLPSGTGTAARDFSVRLAESSDDLITPAMLQQIEQEDYRDRPVTVYDAHFHPDTGALIEVRAMKRGYVDIIEHVIGEEGYVIEARCETRALDYSRTNGRKRSMTDQKRRDANDVFFEHAATAGRIEIAWGRARRTAISSNGTPLSVSGAARGFQGLR